MSPVHNLFFALTFLMKTPPHSGVGTIEQASSQDLDYCAAYNGFSLERLREKS
jgi:hypothetical protein